MKQAYKNLEKSQFERLGDKFQTVVLWTGVLFFASLLCRVLYEETAYRPFFNQFNPVVKFLINHSINYRLIWFHISPIICIWCIGAVIVAIWAAKNYVSSIREEYLIKTTSKLCSLNTEIDELKAMNKFMDEAFRQCRKDSTQELIYRQNIIDQYAARYDRKRNEKGQFLPKNK